MRTDGTRVDVETLQKKPKLLSIQLAHVHTAHALPEEVLHHGVASHRHVLLLLTRLHEPGLLHPSLLSLTILNLQLGPVRFFLLGVGGVCGVHLPCLCNKVDKAVQRLFVITIKRRRRYPLVKRQRLPKSAEPWLETVLGLILRRVNKFIARNPTPEL